MNYQPDLFAGQGIERPAADRSQNLKAARAEMMATNSDTLFDAVERASEPASAPADFWIPIRLSPNRAPTNSGFEEIKLPIGKPAICAYCRDVAPNLSYWVSWRCECPELES